MNALFAQQLDTVELPREVLEELEEMRASQRTLAEQKLHELAGILLDRRRTAITGRQTSGIEEVWRYCEEAYAGIDDLNRAEFNASNRWIKPPSMDGGLRKDTGAHGDDVRSTIFMRMTARYVDMGAAKIQELLLAPDEKSFTFDATPVPEQLEAQKNPKPVLGPDGQPLQRDPFPHEVLPQQPAVEGGIDRTTIQPAPMDLSGQPGKPLSMADLAEEAIQAAQDKAKKAEKRVYDWLVECQHAKQMRRVVHDAARIGVGVLKGPIASERQAMKVQRSEAGGIELQLVSKIAPSTQRISAWDFFPDPACGEDIQSGEYTWERQPLSRKALQRLASLPGYLPNEIAKVLKGGPAPAVTGATENPQEVRSEQPRPLQYEAWFYYGSMTHEEYQRIYQQANQYPKGADPVAAKQELRDIPVQATIVNDCIIGVVLQPLDSGAFPYYTLPWTHREGYWAGVGVSEQVMNPQRLGNAAIRAYSDNAGLSAGFQLVVNRGLIEPENDDWTIKRNKIWFAKTDVGGFVDDVRKAMMAIQFPDAHQQLSWLLEFCFRLAEESTNIPLVTQGWSGKTAPDTATGQRLQDTNANQLLRSVALTTDDHVTGPLARALYEWLLTDPDVPEDEKGDFLIFARGSTAIVERSIQEQTLQQSGELVSKAYALFGIDPKKWFAEFWTSKRLDPRKIQYTEAELRKKEQEPQQVPPEVQAAQIRAQAELQRAQLTGQLTMQELQLKRELAMLEYANMRQVSLEEVKASLAETVMKLRTQKELAAQDRAAEVLKPPTEPAGRAPNGQSFER